MTPCALLRVHGTDGAEERAVVSFFPTLKVRAVGSSETLPVHELHGVTFSNVVFTKSTQRPPFAVPDCKISVGGFRVRAVRPFGWTHSVRSKQTSFHGVIIHNPP